MAKRKLKPTVTIGGAPAGYKPVETGTPFGQAQAAPTAAPQSPAEQALAILNRQSTRLGNLEQLAQAATDPVPLSRVQEREATAEARGLVTQANRDLQRDNLALAASRIGGGDGTPLTTYTAPDGTIFTDLAQYNAYINKTKTEEKRRQGQSAYDILFSQFDRYGLGSLVQEVQKYIVDGLSQAEFTIKLRESKPYQERFAANAKRIAAGFRAIDEATYLELEDSYQSIMQNYGLAPSYYSKGNLGVQKGFENLIAGNVDPVTLEERIIEGQKVTKGSKSIIDTAKQIFPTLTDGDFLAYVLDPENALTEIKRKVAAVEIGASTVNADLNIDLQRALELGTAGVTKEEAERGFTTIGAGLQRGSQLASIYKQDPYTQAVAESEVFNIPGAQEARKKRQKITGLEKAAFSGQTGVTAGALTRDRAGGY